MICCFQWSHAEQINRRLEGFDQRFLDVYERVDAMGYDERRATLRHFTVQVTLLEAGPRTPVCDRLGASTWATIGSSRASRERIFHG